MLHLTQGHYAINNYKYLAYYADLMNSTEDPVERISLLTAANMVRQVHGTMMSRGMPPIPIPIGSTFSAKLPNGTKAYLEHVGPKMINSVIQIEGKNGSFAIYGVMKDTVKSRGLGGSKMAGNVDKKDILVLKDGTKYEITSHNQ